MWYTNSIHGKGRNMAKVTCCNLKYANLYILVLLCIIFYNASSTFDTWHINDLSERSKTDFPAD